jgi:hypothetical protein
MDCPSCMGSGEMECSDSDRGLIRLFGTEDGLEDHSRGKGYTTCDRCGGAGYLEQPE